MPYRQMAWPGFCFGSGRTGVRGMGGREPPNSSLPTPLVQTSDQGQPTRTPLFRDTLSPSCFCAPLMRFRHRFLYEVRHKMAPARRHAGVAPCATVLSARLSLYPKRIAPLKSRRFNQTGCLWTTTGSPCLGVPQRPFCAPLCGR